MKTNAHIGIDPAHPDGDKTVYTIKTYFSQPYCTDRYGVCEENEVCYCNRYECPNPDCKQLLPSIVGIDQKGSRVSCNHCQADILLA